MVILGRKESLRRLQEARDLTREDGEPTRRVKEVDVASAERALGVDRAWMGSLASRG